MTTASFAPDGRTIVTASQDGTARIWDATAGRESHAARRTTAPLDRIVRRSRFSAHRGRVRHTTLGPRGPLARGRAAERAQLRQRCRHQPGREPDRHGGPGWRRTHLDQGRRALEKPLRASGKAQLGRLQPRRCRPSSPRATTALPASGRSRPAGWRRRSRGTAPTSPAPHSVRTGASQLALCRGPSSEPPRGSRTVGGRANAG